jgi:hypothetical protein
MTPTPRRSGIRLPWSQHEETDAAQPAKTGAEAPEAPTVSDATATEAGPKAETTATPEASAAAGGAMQASAMAAPAAEAPMDDADNALLASLITAMREVAERERESSVSTLRQSVDESVETLRTRAAEQGEQLRERSESDIAAIGDWVNAETERIAAEGDRRRETRRQLLTQQLSDHEQRSGTEIESLYARIQEYERELTTFFAQLHDINDPAAFGTAAKRMPRPPSIAAAAPAATPTPEPTAEAAGKPDSAQDATGEGGEPAAATAVASVDESSRDAPAEPMAAEATAEASAEAPGTDATSGEATTAEATTEEATTEEATTEEAASPEADDAAETPETPEEPAAGQPARGSSSIVPDTHDARLSALGIDRNGSDAESADEEAAPASAEATTADGEPATGPGAEAPSDPLRARLAELDAKISSDATAEPATATVVAPGAAGEVATAIVVHGLGSFGAITSFKQALERVDGVHGISLSLGPTGEFVYRATHEAEFDLVAAIEQIEHGGAQIERQPDGSLRVVVQRGR